MDRFRFRIDGEQLLEGWLNLLAQEHVSMLLQQLASLWPVSIGKRKHQRHRGRLVLCGLPDLAERLQAFAYILLALLIRLDSGKCFKCLQPTLREDLGTLLYQLMDLLRRRGRKKGF